MIYSTSIAVAAGLCLAVGVLYLFFGARDRSRRRRSLLFSGFALSYAGAIITARASYAASTPGDFVAMNRVSLLIASAGFVFFIWYVAAYTSFEPLGFLRALTAGLAAGGLLLILRPSVTFSPEAGTEILELPWGETIRVLGSEPSAGLLLTVLLLIVVLAYVILAGVHQYRRGQAQEALVLGVGVGWFAAMLLLEYAANAGFVVLPPVADFGFLGFLVVLSFAMVNETIETEESLRRYRADLENMVDDRTKDLREAQARLLEQAEEQAAVAERTRLARELHDVVTQLLFSMNLIAGSLPRLWKDNAQQAERSTAELQRLARGALSEMRILLRELRPNSISGTDLATLVTQLSDGLGARHDMPIDVTIEGSGNVPPDVHLALYRIAQEAMANVARHADANHVDVLLRVGPTTASLTVRDDGVGFDPSETRGDAMGLVIMRERADAVGASVAIDTSPGGGTGVVVSWEGTRG